MRVVRDYIGIETARVLFDCQISEMGCNKENGFFAASIVENNAGAPLVAVTVKFDEQEMLAIIKQYLRQQGHTARWVSARRQLSKHSPAAIGGPFDEVFPLLRAAYEVRQNVKLGRLRSIGRKIRRQVRLFLH